MARADRLERLDRQRHALELEYEEALVQALRGCAAGSWGLFDHNQNRHERSVWNASVAALRDMGNEIEEMREALCLPPFDLHHEFEAARGPVASNAPGEPKQAGAWLEKLGKSA